MVDGLRIDFRSRSDDKMSGLCPHCDEELELDISLTDWIKRPDDEFECPHCGGEFSFHTWRKWRGVKSEFKWIFGNPRTWNHRPFWFLSLMLTFAVVIPNRFSTLQNVLILMVSLAVLLFTTFIEIRNLVSRLSK